MKICVRYTKFCIYSIYKTASAKLKGFNELTCFQDTKLEELDAKPTHFDSRNKTNQWLQNDFKAFSKEKDVHKASVAFSHLDNVSGFFIYLEQRHL